MYVNDTSLMLSEIESFCVCVIGALMFLNEATLLNNLRIRYMKNQIYVSNIFWIHAYADRIIRTGQFQRDRNILLRGYQV